MYRHRKYQKYEPGMSWVTFGSPLWRKDTVQTTIKSLPSIDEMKRMEKSFVNDAVKTHKHHSSRRTNIIPHYDAMEDRFAMSYFKSPLTQAIIDRTLAIKEIKNKNDIDMRKNINKLSFRQRCKATPTVDEIRQREKQYVNDAIITEKKRTKYKDIIPVYDASHDDHCKAYFNRPDVKRLVTKTCSPRKPLYRI
ncbi:uncharacterized protein LOC134707767 isoform X1 [Mytilus trossulus]|uniref:uncharacterized protein LOC134707767 isoform X1 n=2 Tax=Mytilus trossulus TaxID=6551 RepID=UPI0030040BF0